MINRFNVPHDDRTLRWSRINPDDNSDSDELTFDCSGDICVLKTPTNTPV